MGMLVGWKFGSEFSPAEVQQILVDEAVHRPFLSSTLAQGRQSR